ncbi:MAG: ABC transporter ATP-binding protein, partial [Trebonia sp.]
SRTTDGLAATVHGAATVEAFGLQAQRIANAEGNVENAYGALRYTLSLRSVLYPVEEIFFTAPIVASLLLGGYCYSRGWVNLGQVTAATLYIVGLMGPLEVLLDWFGTLQSGSASLARLLGVADVSADRQAGPETVHDPRRLVARDLRYAYVDGHDVLRDLNLTVQPGERLAIVGPSGGGKSTLARLLTGIHGPRTGSVTLGGAPLIELPLDDLRGEVALATQDHYVFSGTLRDNLLLAVPAGADDALLHDALNTVEAGDWISELPDGLDTVVGDEGQELSAPQAQQLALARLLLANPGVLVLDEATSLLNPRAARRLERSMSAVLKGRTVIAITHRLSAAHDADRVAVVDGGAIAEIGTHQELLDQGGTYASLWNSWH